MRFRDCGVGTAMAKDETDFDRLLKEAREWEARDRARHKPFGMDEEVDSPPSPAASSAPEVTIEELRKKARANARNAPPAATLETPTSPKEVMTALKAAMKQRQSVRVAQRTKGKGGWGWIWLLIILFFVVKHFMR